ncbi:MAG: peptide deformylase [Chlamydiota bacterium]
MYLTVFWMCAALFLQGTETMIKEEMMETAETPKYLYKILSSKHWQASQNRKTVILSANDDAFIHFSKEDQLDRILAKFWSDAPQFVVLKIDTEKLEGDLVYEANPGGSAKYYHLYQGFIPFGSIAESKIVYREPLDSSHVRKLDIVYTGDPVLRRPARELSVEEILSPEIQNLIEDMKVTMRAAPGVGLAAPQIGQGIQLVVIEDMDHTHLTAAQILERNRYKVPFHVVINPKIFVEETEMFEFFEACLSLPQFVGVIPRAKSVRVECLNEKGEPVVLRGTGWYARILQHEIDHLNGTLWIDRALLPTLMTEENYIKLWKGKSVKECLCDLMQAHKSEESCY